MGFFGSLLNAGGEAVGGMTGVFGDLTSRAGFQNPNSTKEGAALRAQAGDTMSWGQTAANAGQLFGTDYVAPQAQNVTMTQAAVDRMQAAQGQALSGQASSAQGAQLDLSQANAAREGQSQLVGSMQDTAAGKGPSVAQEQLRQSTAATLAGQASAAQSAHGAARLAAMRNAQNNQAQIQQQANSQAAGLRAQEIASAQGNLSNALGLMRSQDVGAASTNAQLAQQSGQFNASNQQAMAMANLGYGNQMSLANMQAQQSANAANSAAANASALQFSQQQNAGAQQTSMANLQAQQNTQGLNFQQDQALVNAQQRVAQGQSDLATTAFQGTADYNKAKMNATTSIGGSLLDNIGSGLGSMAGLGI